ncbi:MAG: bifunctional methylenetetrahydrofolate dehydrogenase/methenyltetrahydrofolate cyclohydrolase FolD [Clostridia bacterium]|nr:bifunctional methylenetetrahydrofolate dehydrogenase/methenyltetrahydrofolate cyclohydrolase FolD [Clostridia bacterium]
MAKIIDGREISRKTREDIKERTLEFIRRYGRAPGLAVVIVGDDPASQIYVRNKSKACEEVGFHSEVIRLSADIPEYELLSVIAKLKTDRSIDGILVQLPLPRGLDPKVIIDAIPPEKDVDAFHVSNVGKIMLGEKCFYPCTPAGIMKMLEYEGISVDGKECVVVGRSNIVGKPMAMLLLHANGTVTVCHSHTVNLKEITSRADILVAAVGKSKFITDDMVKEGAVVIDVGMNRDENGKLTGDVDFEAVEKKASAITPVPGGVGPMTITMLLENTLFAAGNLIQKR